MELLLTLGNAWSKVFLLSMVLFVIAFILIGVMFILAENFKFISSTLTGILAGFFTLAGRFTFITAMVLGGIKLVTKLIL